MQLNLIRLRKSNNITQQNMADLLGVTEETYGKKERGIDQFKADEMFRIAEFFGHRIDQIFLPRKIGDNEFLEIVRR